MAYVLTLQLSFEETVVLVNALTSYVARDKTSRDAQRAMQMLRTVEEALERGPSTKENQ